MPVPTTFADLSTTIASNSPAGSDNVFPQIDDHVRALAGLIASIYANTATNGWVSPYFAKAAALEAQDGSVSAPVYTNTGDTDTGFYFPAANTIAAGTGGTLRITLSSAGLVVDRGAYTSTSSQAFTATPTFDCQLSNAFEFSGAMTGNVTSCTLSNPVAGQTISIRVKQDGTGGRTFAAPAGAKILGSIGSTAGAASILTLTYSAMDSRWEGSWLPLPV